MTPLLLASLLALDAPPPIDASTARAVWLADLHPDRVKPGTTGRVVFVPGSATDVEATGRPGVLRTVRFGAGKTDEGLDIVAPVVLESVLAAGRAVGYTPPRRSPSVRAVPPMSEVTRILSA
ncbi:MAG TPA: hypothetical protein VKD72_15840, partial [Gemmataceae bacterium]|nr:hypothetical protein [Gemmataceae bacterium]